MVEYQSRYLEPRTTRAAGLSRGMASFSAVLLITAVLGHRRGLVDTVAFFWVLGIVALLAAFALLLSGFAFSRLWKFGDQGGHDLTIGALLALVVLAPFALTAYQIAAYPMLRDISSDTDDPPALTVAASLRTPDMNRIEPMTLGERTLQAQAYPLVAGRRYDLSLDRVLDSLVTVLNRQGWQIVVPPPPSEQAKGEVDIEAVARSFILSLPSDIAIRLVDDGDSTFVDMRSASRYGRHDLGDNAQRIIDFLTQLDQEIATQAGTATPAPAQ